MERMDDFQGTRLDAQNVLWRKDPDRKKAEKKKKEKESSRRKKGEEEPKQ